MAKAKKPDRKKILRVGLIQNQRILEERLMRTPETVTVGHDYRKNLLVVPASNLPRTFPVLKWDGKNKGYVLQFTAKMEGRVARGGKVETLEQLRRKGIAKKKKGNLYQVKLTPSMRGRVAIGEATILFQFVTPPRKRARPVLPASMRGGLVNGVDRSLAMLVLFSALVQVGFVIYLESQDWPVREDYDVMIEDRMAQIMAPDEPDEPDEPELDDDGDEEVADDDEDEVDPDPEPEDEPTPDDVAEERHDERMEVTERVEDTTIIGTLAADGEDGTVERIADRIGDLDAADAFDGASRVETGGLDTDRFGSGGSPDATGAEDLAAGEDMEEIGADADVDTGDRQEQAVETVEPDVQAQAPDDTGELDTQQLMRALARLRNNIEGCYRDYLRQNPRAAGSVRVMITVTDRGGRGVISNADVVADEVGGGVGECISRQLSTGRIGRLAAPEDGDARITVPYHFSPGG